MLVAEHPVLSQLWAAWSAKRRRERAPRRADIDFGAIRHLLPQLELVERDAAGSFRSRPAGPVGAGGFGRFPRARFLHEVMPANRLEAVNRQFAMAWWTGRPLCARNRDAAGGGVERVTTRIVLPLADEGGAVVALLTAQVIECRLHSHAHHWLRWQLETKMEQISFLDHAPATVGADHLPHAA